jgi:hypothetical protein
MLWKGFLLLCAFFTTASAHAELINPSSLANPLNLLEDDVVGPLLTTIGFAVDNKAYEPATPLGTSIGLDVGVIATMINIPQSFNQALSEAGAPSSDTDIHFLPVPELSIHKGVTSFFDVGVSGVWYQTYKVIGADAKLVVYQPDEGPTWALRLNYAASDFLFAATGVSVEMKTQTIKPELVVSKALDFADPYLDFGYEYTRGTMSVTVDPDAFDPIIPINLPVESESASTHASAFVAGIGLAMRMPVLGLRLTLDAEYQSQGANSLGVKVGFCF